VTVSRRESRQKNVLAGRELAEHLSVHPSTIYRMLKDGTIPAFRLGSDWRFNLESIDKWRKSRESVR